MKYMKLGKTDINVSVIGFGTWGLGGGNVWSDMKPDAVQTSALLDERVFDSKIKDKNSKAT